jgi:hypothetical protein
MSLTIASLKAAAPAAVKKVITQDFVDKVNALPIDPNMREIFLDNIIGYTHVLTTGRFKLDSYIAAVKYVSFKTMGGTDINAFVKTFPAKYDDWVIQKITPKDISSYISAYTKSKLVTTLLQQMAIPVSLLNADKMQAAINTQFNIMQDEGEKGPSFKVRSDAANSLMTHLKVPETVSVEIDMGISTSKSVDELFASMRALSEKQYEMVQNKLMTPKDVAESGLLIEGDTTKE